MTNLVNIEKEISQFICEFDEAFLDNDTIITNSDENSLEFFDSSENLSKEEVENEFLQGLDEMQFGEHNQGGDGKSIYDFNFKCTFEFSWRKGTNEEIKELIASEVLWEKYEDYKNRDFLKVTFKPFAEGKEVFTKI